MVTTVWFFLYATLYAKGYARSIFRFSNKKETIVTIVTSRSRPVRSTYSPRRIRPVKIRHTSE